MGAAKKPKKPAWPKQEEYGAKVKKICLIRGREIEPGEWYDYIKTQRGEMDYAHHDCVGGR